MKKGILSITALAVVLLISFTSLTVKPAANATEKKPAVAVSEEKALGARFLNMLNHNFVYNDAFESVYEMTACSEVALLDKAEDGYIKQAITHKFEFYHRQPCSYLLRITAGLFGLI